MDTKVTAILSYFGLILWIIAYIAGDKEGAKFWLNQSLVLTLSSVVLTFIFLIPILGWIVGFIGYILIAVFWLIGLIYACKGEEKPLPLIGGIQILK